ncbi:MAG TPA: glutamyl-tRNA reductase [Candidatus Micrarchaeia archaeon]|nr:glutamyl-tRNA reductase [Candidatus Micrarchaeia archaeon]
MTLVAVGVSHHLAPVALRERVHLDGTTIRATLAPLVRHAGLGGAVCLSTCNRTEFYVSAQGQEQADQAIDRFRRYLVPGPDGSRYVHAATGGDALAHVFRVASGLDSMVVGEAQILAQVKRAHRLAHEAGALDPALDLVMRRAVTAAKRVRTETGIGRRAVGIAQAAVDEARRRRDLVGARVLLVGAGQVGAGVARLLRGAGAAPPLVVERGPRSRALAASLGGEVVARDRLAGWRGAVDVLVCATSQSSLVIGAAAVAELQGDSGRALLVLDLAVPRDVDPDARGLAGVDLVDLDDLGAAIRANLDARAQHLRGADALIAAAVAGTLTELASRRAAPVIRRLVDRTEAQRQRELERSLGRLGTVGTGERRELERLTQALASKLLHAPIRYLRHHADDPARTALALEVLGLDLPGKG